LAFATDLARELPARPSKQLGMDRFATLNTFVIAAELRSFTAAGRQLGVTSSAVGKVIGRLEDRLGVRLFHRNTRTVSLTGEGEQFLKRCRSIFSELEAAEIELGQSLAEPRGRLRVGLPLSGMLLIPPIAAFAAAYPDIDLDLDFTDRVVDVIDERFDVVLRAGDLTDSQLMTRSLGEFTYRIVAAPGYLMERGGRPETPEALIEFDCLHHRLPSSGRLERWALVRNGVDLDLELPVRAVASTIEPLVAMAEAGLGIAYVPRFAVRRQLAEGRLVSLLDEFVQGAGILRLVWPSSRHTSHKVKVFVDFMSQRLLPRD
jgi:DNA-binding transcriptional LysR family regulator